MTDALDRLTRALQDRYRIDGELGAGGMATVYSAYDLKHQRQVALKVLRPELAAVIGAERFLAEIRTTANLQHAHILPLHDSGEISGTVFYVMPFVDGESLRDRIAREKQLPIADAVRLATEVAGALDYAHRHGVIHRDIKPENLLLHEGQAFVADFGIALAASRSDGSARLTETGMSLGTPHYMSPEQAMGERNLDARTDVYALGCVLYEMLTGEPPFAGPSAQAIVAKVMTETPVPVSRLRRTAPAHVERAVMTALQKLPADRFASAAAFGEALANPAYGEAAARALAGPRVGSARIAWALAALAVLAAGFAMLRPRAPAPPDSQILAATIELPSDVYIAYPLLAFSPDGGRLYLSVRQRGIRHLFERRLDEPGGRLVPGTTEGYMHFAAGDGQWLYFRQGWSQGLAKVPVAGGPAVLLDPTAQWADGDVGPDGTVYYSRSYKSGVWRVPPDGAPEQVTAPDSTTGELGHWSPRLLPDGRHLMYTAFRTPIDSARIEIVSLETGDRKVVQRGGIFGQVAGGFLFYARKGVVFAAPFDAERTEVAGEAIPVIDGVAMQPEEGVAAYAVSSRGTLAYVASADYDAPSDLVWVDRRGNETRALMLTDRFDEPAISPDGRRIAVALAAAGEAADVWVFDVARGTRTRLTTGGGADFGPIWSPDGRTIVYMAERPVFDLFARGADASSPARALVVNEFDKYGGSFADDGRTVIFALTGEKDQEIWRVGVDGSNPAVLMRGDEAMSNPSVPPNGRWLAFESDQSGAREIYVVPYPAVTGRRQAISNAGGTEPRWTRGGREVVWRNGADVVSATFDAATGEVGRPVVLFSGDYQFSPRQRNRSWDASADGERFLLVKRPGDRAPRRIVVVTNWLEQLRGRMQSAKGN